MNKIDDFTKAMYKEMCIRHTDIVKEKIKLQSTIESLTAQLEAATKALEQLSDRDYCFRQRSSPVSEWDSEELDERIDFAAAALKSIKEVK